MVKRINRELEVEILRLHGVEKWPVGTIAAQLKVHHQVVRRVLEQAGTLAPRRIPRPKMVEPFVPFVLATFEKYPNLRASRLHQMVKERGYTGSESHFRRSVAKYRPRPRAEAFARLKAMPAEQAQVDWAHFGKVMVGKAERRLLAFVVTLSYSRRVFVRFFYDARMASFLRGHVDAFAFFGGVPRELLYDNLKSAVIERVNDAIRFNPNLLELSRHYSFKPRAAAPRRGNEKGRVERSIRYIRDSFFAAREVGDLDELNAAAVRWSQDVADQRGWADDRDRKVIDVFDQDERSLLLALPDNPFHAEERVDVRIGKTPYARFDKNDYSVPHEHVRKDLEVLATVERVRIVEGLDVVAEHVRSYDKGQQFDDAAHIDGLVEAKRAARKERGADRLSRGAPAAENFLTRAARRNLNLGSIVARLLLLLDEYGPSELQTALIEINEREVMHVHSVQQLLEQRRHASGRRPAIPVELPDEKLRAITVRPHSLDAYVELTQDEREDDNDDPR